MYAVTNFKTKKALKEAVKAGPVEVYKPGLGGPVKEGRGVVEGPHYPEPHRWYAAVLVEGGMVVKVTG